LIRSVLGREIRQYSRCDWKSDGFFFCPYSFPCPGFRLARGACARFVLRTSLSEDPRAKDREKLRAGKQVSGSRAQHREERKHVLYFIFLLPINILSVRCSRHSCSTRQTDSSGWLGL